MVGKPFYQEKQMDRQTLPDSPAPSNSILISFFAIIRSRFSWLSIASLPVQRRQNQSYPPFERGGHLRALASSSTPVDCTQPMAKIKIKERREEEVTKRGRK